MPRPLFKHIFKHPLLTGVFVFIVLMLLTQFLTYQKHQLHVSETQLVTVKEIDRINDQFRLVINNAVLRAESAKFVVEEYGIPQDFNVLGAHFIAPESNIDVMEIVLNGVTKYVYPLEGNKYLLNYDLTVKEKHLDILRDASESEGMYFSGLFDFRKGGKGVEGYLPIKMEDSLNFIVIVLRLDDLLDEIGIDATDSKFRYQFSKKHPETGDEEFFLSTPSSVEDFEKSKLETPGGTWYIYAKVIDSVNFNEIVILGFLGLILSLSGGFLTWVLIKKPKELENQVNLQSRTILENKRRFQALVENSLDAVAIISPDGSNKYVSPSVTSVLGYTVKEAMGINLFDIMHDDDKPFVVEEMNYIMQNPGETILGHISRIKHKDGSWRWIESSITNLLEDPAVNGIVDNFRDITDRIIAQDQLIKENKLSEAVINSLPGIFYLFNQKGKFLLWNTNFETVSEYSGEEIKEMHPSEFFEGQDRVHIQERIMETFEKGESFAEAYFTSKTGEKIYHYFTGSLIDYNGETCLLGTGIDTSKRRKAEEELEKSEEQLLSIFNNSISAVVMMDSDGKITNWNATAEQMFGWRSEEVMDKPMHEFIMPEAHKASHFDGMEKFKKTGKGPIINSNIEITAITKSKKEIDISLGVTTVKIRGKEYFIGFINDITQRKEAERLKEYEKRNREALINATEDQIWSVNKEIMLISANSAFKKSFENYTGVTINEGDYALPDKLFDAEYLNLWKKYYKRGLKGERFTVETTIPPNVKQIKKTVETSFSPVIVNGQVLGVACFARNITERIVKEEEIKEYNAKLKTAQEIAQLGYWEHTHGDEKLYWSDQIYKIWELDKEEYTPNVDSFFDSVVPEDRDKFNLYANRPIDNFKEQDIEYRIITATGKLKWIHQYGEKTIEKEKNQTIFKGTIRDITEQKNQEEAILVFNKKLQTAQKIAKLGYWEFDFKNEILIWTDQVYEIWEKPKNTFKVTPEAFYDTIHPDDKEEYLAEQKKALKGEKAMDIEHRIVLDNGEIKWVLERGKLIYNPTGDPLIFEGTVQDITGQKLIELELREQNYFIKTAMDNLPVGIAVRNIHNGKFTLMNKKFTDIYGWSKKEFRDVDSFFNKVYPDPEYRKKIQDQIFSDLASNDVNRMQWEGLQVTTKKGEKRLINAKNIPLYDQDLMISTVLDVTEKALAEQRLALSNERYEYVTKATFDAIWDWDFASDNMFWGEGFKTIFGHKVENTNPDFWYSNIHPDDFERVKTSLENAIEKNERNWETEYRFKHANGTYRFVKDRGIILRNMERKALRIIGAMQDITSQKEYEMKLLDVNQKLRNLSAHLQEAREEERISIAREIHDELGQQLTGIKLDVSWLKNKVESKFPEDTERTVRLIDNINKTINDVRKIASHLRPGVLDDLGLEAAIEWQTHQFQEQTGIQCALHFENVSGDYGKEINTAVYRIYQEALTNVMRHAKATEVKTNFMEIDNTLILEVIDNGIGIDEADKNNTFSLGITGMRERALMVNARFFVKRQKEGGTKVKVSVNLNS